MKLMACVQLFRGLADATRVRILNVLTQARELNGTEIADLLRVPRARVARHLRYLYRSRLVTTRRKGPETFYGVRVERNEPIHVAISGMIGENVKHLEGLERDNEAIRALGES